MSNRTAIRLDDSADDDLKYLVEIYGSQTAAIKAALVQLARRERLNAAMRDFVAATEAEGGPLTEAEMTAARSYFA